MSSLFDFDAAPDRYAVMGNPVSHSLSPRIHAEFARRTRQRLVYTAIQVDEGGFAQALGNFFAAGGKGLNITVPFKQQAWTLVDRRSGRAERAGAVNTIRLEADGTLYGDNTDGAGLARDLDANLSWPVAGRRVLLVGAGGAVRGVVEALLALRPAALAIVNRSRERALELRDLFAGGDVAIDARGFDELAGERFDLVVNGTSASLHGEELPLPASVLAPGCRCYDMMYGAEPTPFLHWASREGAAGVADGLGMLIEQAAEAFTIWRGVQPDTAGLEQQLRAHLRGGKAPA
jgi:shikimate dehydrogenase